MVEDSWQAGLDHTPKRRLVQTAEIEHMTSDNPKSGPEIAAQLIANGYQPVPIPHGKKGPRAKGWQKRTFTPADFAADANVGIRCGDYGVAFCDIDVYCPETAKAIAAEWLRRFLAPHRNWMQRTGQAPKTGFVFQYSKLGVVLAQSSHIPTGMAPLDKTGKPKDEKVEVLSSGQQFVAYGIHPDTGQPYRWGGDKNTLDPTNDVLGLAARLPVITPEEVADFLEWVSLTFGPVSASPSLSEQATAAIQPPAGTGFHIDTGGPKSPFWRAVNDAAMADLDAWVPDLLPAARKHNNGAWRITSRNRGRDLEEDLSFHPDGIRDHGEECTLTPINAVQQYGRKDAMDAAHWLCDRLGIDPTTLGWQQQAVAAQKITGSDEIELIRNKRGHPAWCTENACLILETTPDWAGVLAYNEETALTLLLRPIPGSRTPKASFKPRPIAEADLTATLRWFNRNGFPDATRNIVADAVFATAAQSVIAPVRNYLEALSWDGVERITTWLSVYGGADDLPIIRRMGRAWMISAVARALQPGCKADCALILEGGQGVGKSSAARVLASEDWFSDSLRDLHGKDASAALRGRWIIELPELSAMRRSESEAVKAFLSRTDERYRPPYGRTEVIEPRRCVFIGTTNRTDYLTDDTGNRRFWPVSIKRFDLDALRRDRDQLWAEAVTAFRAGEAWWLDREAETEAAALTSQRQADDPWESKVLEAVIGKAHTSTRAMLDAIGLDPVHRTKADSMRVAGILNRAGWLRDGKYSAGLDRGQARYVPPPSEEPQRGTS